jgi:predicted nucleotidyltransferase
MLAMDAIAALAERVRREDHTLFALLFGSRAAGSPRPGSDWDVAVYLSPGLTPRERLAVRLRLLADLEDLGSVDVVVLNDAPPLLAHRALQGRPLFKKDASAYVRFFVRTLAEAGDEAHWRDLHRTARAARLAEGSFGRP